MKTKTISKNFALVALIVFVLCACAIGFVGVTYATAEAFEPQKIELTNATATVSTVSEGSGAALTDGDYGTWWRTAHDSYNTTPFTRDWVSVELGEAKEIGSVKLYQSNHSTAGFVSAPKSFKIYYSRDGKSFREVPESGTVSIAEADWEGENKCFTYTFPHTVRAKTVKIEFAEKNANDCVGLSEIELYTGDEANLYEGEENFYVPTEVSDISTDKADAPISALLAEPKYAAWNVTSRWAIWAWNVAANSTVTFEFSVENKAQLGYLRLYPNIMQDGRHYFASTPSAFKIEAMNNGGEYEEIMPETKTDRGNDGTAEAGFVIGEYPAFFDMYATVPLASNKFRVTARISEYAGLDLCGLDVFMVEGSELERGEFVGAELIDDGVKKIYGVGETVSVENLSVKLKYENSEETVPVTTDMIENFTELTSTAGTKTVTVKIADHPNEQLTYQIEVVDIPVLPSDSVKIDTVSVTATVTSTLNGSGADLLDGNPATFWRTAATSTSHAMNSSNENVTFTFAEQTKMSAVKLVAWNYQGALTCVPTAVRLEYSRDGRSFRTVAGADNVRINVWDTDGSTVINFGETVNAKAIRIVFVGKNKADCVGLADVEFYAADSVADADDSSADFYVKSDVYDVAGESLGAGYGAKLLLEEPMYGYFPSCSRWLSPQSSVDHNVDFTFDRERKYGFVRVYPVIAGSGAELYDYPTGLKLSAKNAQGEWVDASEKLILSAAEATAKLVAGEGPYWIDLAVNSDITATEFRLAVSSTATGAGLCGVEFYCVAGSELAVGNIESAEIVAGDNAKYFYKKGETVDVSGLKIKINYEHGFDLHDVTADMVQNADTATSAAGKSQIQIKHSAADIVANYEIEVLDVQVLPENSVNLTDLNKKPAVQQSSNYAKNHGGKFLVDGKLSTYWCTQTTRQSYKMDSSDEFVQFAFNYASGTSAGETARLSSIKLHRYTSGAPTIVTVEYSKDGISFHTVPGAERIKIRVWDDDAAVINFTGAIEAKIVRLVFVGKPAGEVLALNEVEFYYSESVEDFDDSAYDFCYKSQPYSVSAQHYMDGYEVEHIIESPMYGYGLYQNRWLSPMGVGTHTAEFTFSRWTQTGFVRIYPVISADGSVIYNLPVRFELQALGENGKWQSIGKMQVSQSSLESEMANGDGPYWIDLKCTKKVAANKFRLICTVDAEQSLNQAGLCGVEFFSIAGSEKAVGEVVSVETVASKVVPTYYKNQPLSVEGLKLHVTYQYGFDFIDVTADMVENFAEATATVGEKVMLTVSYQGNSAQFEIRVRERIEQPDLSELTKLEATCDAVELVDGNLTTKYKSSSSDKTYRWLNDVAELDLGEVKSVKGIALYVGVKYAPRSIAVEYSTDGTGWAVALAPTLMRDWPDVAIGSTDNYTYAYFGFDGNISARYMRVRILEKGVDVNGEYGVELYEIEIFGAGDEPAESGVFLTQTEIDVNKLMTDSSLADTDLRNLADGKFIVTSSEGTLAKWGSNARPVTVVYDFGKVTNLGKVALTNTSADGKLLDFALKVSIDGVVYVPIPGCAFTDYNDVLYTKEFSFAPVKARYFKLEISRYEGKNVMLEELMLYETETEGVELTAPAVKSVNLGGTFKTEYRKGELLSTVGMIAVVRYEDGSTDRLMVLPSMVEGFDSSKAAKDLELTVAVGGKTAVFNVDIVGSKDAVEESTTITGLKDIALTVGQTMNLRGSVSGVTFAVSDSEVATVDADGKITALKAGETVITVSYGDASEQIKLTVTAAAVEESGCAGALGANAAFAGAALALLGLAAVLIRCGKLKA